MKIIRKDATISPTGADDEFPGSFEVVLSAPTEDRDGETLLPEEWKQPLPARITFDADHGMSVASTVGSGVPRIDPATGNLVVSGTYSSLPRAQEVRTLVNEGHIQTTSVAFMSSRAPMKDGKQSVTRELLNGAFVAIPSNREALVMASKSVEEKAGARNSAADMAHVQAIHDHALALGAMPMMPKSFGRKDADAEDQSNPAALIAAVDASIDQAIDLFAAVDAASLPAEVQQAIALVQAADATVDELLDALGIPDPDEAVEPADVTPAPAPAKSAAAAAAVTKAAEDADMIRMHERSIQALAGAYLTD